MFFVIAGCLVLAVGTVLQVRRATAVRSV